METESRHSFYKILVDLTVKLGLPEGFTKRCKLLSPDAKLRITSGATWDVRVEKLKGEGYFFTSGWAKFCQDMKLEISEILLFSYAGRSTFHVSVFANTALEKKSNFLGIKYPNFKVSLKKYLNGPYLGSDFVKACGLANKRKVRLEYPGGQSAEVVLRLVKRRGKASSLTLGAGWMGFRKANRLIVDKTYSFEFIPRKNEIRVEPV